MTFSRVAAIRSSAPKARPASFADGAKFIQEGFNSLLSEVEEAIGKVDAGACLIKESKEKTKKLGVEVQFGKYSFMVYNVCAKMTIFKNLGYILAGVEIVPVKEFAEEMSTGVSYFEQFVWDLEKRGNADIDVPTLIIGIGV